MARNFRKKCVLWSKYSDYLKKCKLFFKKQKNVDETIKMSMK